MILDSDNWQEIFNTLKKNRIRSFLTAFGVFWGIFMLIIMLGSGKGLENGVTNDFSGIATNSVFLWTRNTTKPYKGYPAGRRFGFTNSDIEAISSNIHQVEYLAPRNQLSNNTNSNNVTYHLKTGIYSVYGDYPTIRNIQLVDMIQGRFLNAFDIKYKRKVTVIGERVFQELFKKGESPIGKYIRVKGIYFKVVGVYRSKDKDDPDERRSKVVNIPFTTFQKVFNYGDRVGWFSMTAKKGFSAAELRKDVMTFLAVRHQVDPNDERAFGYWNMEKEFNKISRLFDGITFLIWFVGIFTLLAGIIGVSNIMLITVKERTKEFGIKRAIGATPSHIITQIILETILLTSVSGYFGLVTGIGLIELVATILDQLNINAMMFANPEVDFKIAITAIVVLILSGALAGLIPAQRAISIKPVDAIRDE
jgi:putative ABC transport system permease protein